MTASPNDPDGFVTCHRPAVVVNPAKVPDAAALRDGVHSICAERGLPEPMWLETTEEDPGHGQARRALAAGADLVLVCGGDGTVAAVVSVLQGGTAAVALLPAGTGNLLARNLDIPLDLAAALAVAFGPGRQQIDVVQGEPGRHWVVMAGLGFDAAMIAETNERTKARLGWPAYIGGLARALRRSPAADFRISVDGGAAVHYRAVGVLAGNVGRLQAGLTVLPDAAPDDGILDLLVFAPESWYDWPRILFRLITHRAATGGHTDVLRGARIEIACDRRLPLEFDGELVGDVDVLDLIVLPAALTVCVPAGTPGAYLTGPPAGDAPPMDLSVGT